MDMTNRERREPTTARLRVDPASTLNELVGKDPRALPVLDRFGLDTCCGGALPLEEAARRHGVELAELLATLEEALDRP
jgi:regulator of cell morphogenesis and NO signaling